MSESFFFFYSEGIPKVLGELTNFKTRLWTFVFRGYHVVDLEHRMSLGTVISQLP